MRLNNIDITDQNNRPSVDGRIALRSLFLNDGEYIDPTSIRDVMVFKYSANITPSSIVGNDGLISQTYSSNIVAAFGVSAQENVAALDPSSYFYSASGIYRIGQGDYVCVLDGITLTSATISPWGTDIFVENSASTTGEYFAAWTVLFPSQSEYKVVFNKFELFNDTFINISEPLMVRTNNVLTTKKIPLGSKRDIKITTEFTIENKDIDQSIKNLFKSNIAINPALEIVKINDDINLPSRVEVSGFADTSSLINITSNNTFIYSFDTNTLRTHPKLLSGELGSMTGIYYVRIKYTLLNETIISPAMFLQIQ